MTKRIYTTNMNFEWDENKNKANIIKHGISFEDAKLIFNDTVLTQIDTRFNYQEIRKISIGNIDGTIITTVVHTPRNSNIRIISARIADKKERKAYNNFLKGEKNETQ